MANKCLLYTVQIKSGYAEVWVWVKNVVCIGWFKLLLQQWKDWLFPETSDLALETPEFYKGPMDTHLTMLIYCIFYKTFSRVSIKFL